MSEYQRPLCIFVQLKRNQSNETKNKFQLKLNPPFFSRKINASSILVRVFVHELIDDPLILILNGFFPFFFNQTPILSNLYLAVAIPDLNDHSFVTAKYRFECRKFD